MGYRSDVAYVISFASIADRDTFVELVKNKNDKFLTEALDECETEHKDRPLITFRADDQKWYESYPDVQAHHNLMDYAVEVYEHTSGWRFIRVGEDDGDVEVNEGGEDCSHLYEILDVARPQISADF